MNKKILFLAPRILCIMAIIFVSLFALDSFNSEKTLFKQIQEFLIHLIPSVVLLGILILAWKKELIGGILFILIGLVFSPWLFIRNYQINHSVWTSLEVVLLISVPFIVVGLLFILSFKKKKSIK